MGNILRVIENICCRWKEVLDFLQCSFSDEFERERPTGVGRFFECALRRTFLMGESP